MTGGPGPADVGRDDTSPSAVVRLLADAGAGVGCAESLTGGLLCGALTSVPGSSAVVRGGVVAYTWAAKTRLLDVPADLLAERGAVDPDVAWLMASSVRALFGCGYGVATTGVAGPDTSDGKPVGTVYVAVAGPHAVRVEALTLEGDRRDIREATVAHALALLAEVIAADPP